MIISVWHIAGRACHSLQSPYIHRLIFTPESFISIICFYFLLNHRVLIDLLKSKSICIFTFVCLKDLVPRCKVLKLLLYLLYSVKSLSYCKNKACAFTLVITKSSKQRISSIYVFLVLRFLRTFQAVFENSKSVTTEVAPLFLIALWIQILFFCGPLKWI